MKQIANKQLMADAIQKGLDISRDQAAYFAQAVMNGERNILPDNNPDMNKKLRDLGAGNYV